MSNCEKSDEQQGEKPTESEIFNNIYSEPLFGPTQSEVGSTCASSTQLTQIEEALAAQVDDDDRKTRKCTNDRGGYRSKAYDEDDEVFSYSAEEEDSESSEFDFNLDSMVMKASQMSQDFCTTGCPHLDSALHGGIPTFGITELFGEGGAGKTQLCLQLAITAQLPKACGGLDAGGVYYICTEDVLPTKRLAELIGHFKKKFPQELPADPMNNIFIEHVSEAEALMQCVEIKLSSLVRMNPERKVRLVIVDSVAAIFRTEFDDLGQRTDEMRSLAQTLHEYSHDHDAAIVVCNQVTANLNLEGNVASLGMSWKNMITTRIRISKSENSSRALYVSFSPHVPSIHVLFRLSAAGIEGIPPLPQQN